MTRRPFAVLALAVTAVLTVGCGDDATSSPSSTVGSTAAAAKVVVSGAWARTSPASATNGAAYLTVTAAADDALVAAKAPSEIAGMTEIHETVAADMGSATTLAGSATTMGAMTMKPVAKIALPAGKAVELKPGGYHVMLMKLAKPLTKGQTFDLELTFEKAGKRTVKVEVRDNA
ncbi:MAG: copper chaperone PCu(A)C [Acidimicrobiales bacterium]